ncbi:hypothetical protein RRG08_052424 [Elysia crispata]|uniref:Uncharacterized protein n=1 Tax=Elysia crispata TaxID=231223 RepID=A0AAE1B1W5_9GAST|nr:hypothetical protein RRG08_052424 [Elysia crispata]
MKKFEHDVPRCRGVLSWTQPFHHAPPIPKSQCSAVTGVLFSWRHARRFVRSALVSGFVSSYFFSRPARPGTASAVHHKESRLRPFVEI